MTWTAYRQSLSYAGAVTDVLVATSTPSWCSGDRSVPDTLLTVIDQRGTWTISVDFAIDVSVGDEIEVNRLLTPSGPFDSRDSFTMRRAKPTGVEVRGERDLGG